MYPIPTRIPASAQAGRPTRAASVRTVRAAVITAAIATTLAVACVSPLEPGVPAGPHARAPDEPVPVLPLVANGGGAPAFSTP